jgi:hypothetical protein
MTSVLPSIEVLKEQAKRLRTSLQEPGRNIGHSEALEAIARQYGFRDWNTLRAKALSNRQRAPVNIGDTVNGEYLGQHFTGRILGVGELAVADRYRITVKFDEPVDVVTFDSFSAFRRRVHCVIDGTGTSPQKTSNGQPHLRLSV